jgi:hypothetical protein
MKRYRFLVNSVCLVCGKWLCVTGGEYTGDIVCYKCGAINEFRNSLKPVGAQSDDCPVTVERSSAKPLYVSSA